MRICDCVIGCLLAIVVFEVGLVVSICKAGEVKQSLTISVIIENNSNTSHPFMTEILVDKDGIKYKRISY